MSRVTLCRTLKWLILRKNESLVKFNIEVFVGLSTKILWEFDRFFNCFVRLHFPNPEDFFSDFEHFAVLQIYSDFCREKLSIIQNCSLGGQNILRSFLRTFQFYKFFRVSGEKFPDFLQKHVRIFGKTALYMVGSTFWTFSLKFCRNPNKKTFDTVPVNHPQSGENCTLCALINKIGLFWEIFQFFGSFSTWGKNFMASPSGLHSTRAGWRFEENCNESFWGKPKVL